MDPKVTEIIKEIEELILEIEIFLKLSDQDRKKAGYSNYMSSVTSLHTEISVIIDRYAPKDSPYYQTAKPFLTNFEERILREFSIDSSLSQLRGILVSLENAYKKGYFTTISGLVAANIFADFLEMAEYFLSQGDQFKHPAAFLIGGVLEEQLRKLAIKNDITILKENGQYRHAEDLNTDLRKKDVYTENEKKSITAWLGLRNDADHAHWEKYSIEKVDIMLKDVRRIINQYPA